MIAWGCKHAHVSPLVKSTYCLYGLGQVCDIRHMSVHSYVNTHHV